MTTKVKKPMVSSLYASGLTIQDLRNVQSILNNHSLGRYLAQFTEEHNHFSVTLLNKEDFSYFTGYDDDDVISLLESACKAPIEENLHTLKYHTPFLHYADQLFDGGQLYEIVHMSIKEVEEGHSFISLEDYED